MSCGTFSHPWEWTKTVQLCFTQKKEENQYHCSCKDVIYRWASKERLTCFCFKWFAACSETQDLVSDLCDSCSIREDHTIPEVSRESDTQQHLTARSFKNLISNLAALAARKHAGMDQGFSSGMVQVRKIGRQALEPCLHFFPKHFLWPCFFGFGSTVAILDLHLCIDDISPIFSRIFLLTVFPWLQGSNPGSAPAHWWGSVDRQRVYERTTKRFLADDDRRIDSDTEKRRWRVRQASLVKLPRLRLIFPWLWLGIRPGIKSWESRRCCPVFLYMYPRVGASAFAFRSPRWCRHIGQRDLRTCTKLDRELEGISLFCFQNFGFGFGFLASLHNATLETQELAALSSHCSDRTWGLSTHPYGFKHRLQHGSSQTLREHCMASFSRRARLPNWRLRF